VTVVAPVLIGLRRAVRLPGLAALLWLANLLLAAVVAVPFWLRLHGALAGAPAGDRLLEGFSFGLLVDLMREHGSLLAPLALSALPVVAAALLVNAFAAGGVLEVLRRGQPGTVLERFAGGGAWFFGRFLRVGVFAGIVTVLGVGAVAVGAAATLRRLQDSTWEPAQVVVWLTGMLAAGLIALVVLLALDLARVRVVRDDRRRVTRAFAGSLWLVFRHPVATLGLWAGLGALFAAALAVYLGARQVLPATSWGGIVLMLLLQQAVMVVRAWLRVALFAGEVELVGRFAPAVPALASRLPVDEPSLELAPRELPLAE
jgi:hypothetical protein